MNAKILDSFLLHLKVKIRRSLKIIMNYLDDFECSHLSLDFRCAISVTTTADGSLSNKLFLFCKSHFRFHSIHLRVPWQTMIVKKRKIPVTSLVEKAKNFM